MRTASSRSTSQAPASIEFRFDAGPHEYIELSTGVVLSHITGMMTKTGLIDDRWFTEDSCERGRHVHNLTAEYDLGAMDVKTLVSDYRGWVLAHVACMKIIRPDWRGIEEPRVSPRYRFGGRPDRWGKVRGLYTVGEVKSGAKVYGKSLINGRRIDTHAVQTALQVILLNDSLGLGLELPAWQRLAFYYKQNGKYKVEEHKDRRDFDEARRVLQNSGVLPKAA